jgi:uncharacterized protein YrzB (UPF0473 family)
MDENRKIVVINGNGDEIEATILFTYEHEERGTKYVFFYEEKNPDEVFCMKYHDDGTLEEIEDEEENEEIAEVFDAYQNDPEIQKIK